MPLLSVRVLPEASVTVAGGGVTVQLDEVESAMDIQGLVMPETPVKFWVERTLPELSV